ERDVIGSLAAREGELVDLARQLIALPSPNPPGDERRVAELAGQVMSSLGYSPVATHAAAEARPNLIGEVGTRGTGRTLVLNGHLDTKPAGDESEWEIGPYDPVVRDGRL